MNANRLKIATRIAAALHSNPSCDCATFDNVTRDAFAQADSLLKYAAQSEHDEGGVPIGRIADWGRQFGLVGTLEEISTAFFAARNR